MTGDDNYPFPGPDPDGNPSEEDSDVIEEYPHSCRIVRDDGQLSLDDPVCEYVPYFETVPGDPITVHELLSHTSGMPSDDSGTLIVTKGLSDADTVACYTEKPSQPRIKNYCDLRSTAQEENMKIFHNIRVVNTRQPVYRRQCEMVS